MVLRNVAKVISVKELSPTTFYIELKPEEHFEYKAGQYMIVQTDIDGKIFRRSYSIASKKDEPLGFCIKRAGIVSKKLGTMKPDEELVIIGPAGHFFRKETEVDEVYIAAGTGIAPFRPMIQESKSKKILLHGVRNPEELLFQEEFKKSKNLEYQTCFSKANGNLVGRVQQHVKGLIRSNNTQFYVCGLKDMVLSTVAELQKEGVERKNIHFERYT